MTTLTRLRPLLRPLLTPGLRTHTAASSSLPPGTSQDPSNTALYYHLVPPPPSTPRAIVLSFLSRAPAARGNGDGDLDVSGTAATATALGMLPALPDAGLNDFKENPRFRPLLHRAVKQGLRKGVAETIVFEAETRPGDGWMHITDERALPPAGRIGETEDLIGSVFVEGGKILPESYEPQPSYRLVTSAGVTQLPRGLDAELLKVLEEVDAEERGEA